MFMKAPEIIFKFMYIAGGYTNIKVYVDISFQELLTSSGNSFNNPAHTLSKKYLQWKKSLTMSSFRGLRV
jgi:hypothetical protein